MLIWSPFYEGKERNLKTQAAYIYRMELEPDVKMLHGKFTELKQFHHLLSLRVCQGPSCGAGSFYLQNVLSSPEELFCNCGFPDPKKRQLNQLNESPYSDNLNIVPPGLLGRHILGYPTVWGTFTPLWQGRWGQGEVERTIKLYGKIKMP